MSRGVERGLLDVRGARPARATRPIATGRVDDVPYGGGPGMVMKAEPLVRAVEAIREPARDAGLGGVALAAGPAVHAGGGRASGSASSTSCCCAAATRGWTSGCASWSATEETVDWRLRAERRRTGGAGRRRRGEPSGARGGGRRAVGGRRIRSRAGCSTTRTTRDRRSSPGIGCRTCCCRAITRTFGAGAGRRRWRGRWTPAGADCDGGARRRGAGAARRDSAGTVRAEEH